MRIDGLWIRYTGDVEFKHSGGPFDRNDGWGQFKDINEHDKPWFIKQLLNIMNRDWLPPVSREIYAGMLDEYYFGMEKDT
jgi:hypothetical protein